MPRKWSTLLFIIAIVCIALEFIGMVMFSLVSDEKIRYSMALIGALVAIGGVGTMKKKFREEAGAAA